MVCESCQAYHRYGNLKSDHKNALWSNKLYGSASSSTPWYGGNRHHGTAATTTTTTAIPHHIRHSGYVSRYPKLDGVMHRLNPSKKPKSTENTNLHGRKSNERHLWDNYYEENDYDEDDVLESIGKEEDIIEDDKWNDDDSYDNDYSESEDDYFDVDDGDEIQAEEATDAPTSSLTDYKWEHYGSRDRVEKSRNMQMGQLRNTVENAADAAVSHYLKVQAAGKCRVPIPKVLPVHSEHPSHGKTYIPHCTILHRCSEDSGCCQTQGTRCGPKSQTIVELYFYTHSRGGATDVEKLSFYNHTECACIDVNELAASNNNAADIVNTVSKKSISLKSALPAENLIRCKCPAQFMPNPRYTSYCSCACSTGDLDCERMQRGMEYLSLKDRVCIKSGQCSPPTCEYGKYLKDVGRCPKKIEKPDAHPNSNPN